MAIKGSPDLSVMITTALVFGSIAGLVFGLFTFTGNDVTITGLVAFSVILLGIQWYLGPSIVRWTSRAQEVSAQQAPELHATVERIAKESGVPKPKLYVVNNQVPNAFAFGRGKSDAGIAVHTGLLQKLSRNEVEAVIAHEMGHIKHNDVMIMTIASVIPVLLYYITIMVLSKNDSRPNPITAWMGGVVVQFLGQLMILWLSRQREYYADAHSARVMKDPMPLASALAKITYNIPGNTGNSSLNTLYVAEHGEVSEGVIRAVGRNDPKALLDAVDAEKDSPLEIIGTHPSLKKRLKSLLS